MDDFSRLDTSSETILKALAERSGSPQNIAFAASVDVLHLGGFLQNLIEHGYIRNSSADKENDTNIYLDDVYIITLSGKAYLEYIDRQTEKEKLQNKKDRRQFYINIFNASVALAAFIKSFLPDFISLLKQ